MQKTSGLGRGLGSLIPSKKTIRDYTSNDEMAEILDSKERILQLSVDQISPNPHQPRQQFDQELLSDLAASIKEHGIIQPLIATKVDGGWQLIAGERRLRAAKLAGLKTVPTIIREMTEQKKMELALIENLQREDLNPIETATAYRKLLDEFNLTQDQLAERVGKSRSSVTNTMRILNTAPQVKEAILTGKISESHARVLAGLPDERDQLDLLDRIVLDKLSVHETEKTGQELVATKKIRKVQFDPEVRAMEEVLQSSLGTKVEIKKFGGSGQIIIKFFSNEEFHDLVKKLS